MSLQAFLTADDRAKRSQLSKLRKQALRYVICKMLDPRRDETIRFFKCQCGEMTTSPSSVQRQFG
jgi:hypothetical protein